MELRKGRMLLAIGALGATILTGCGSSSSDSNVASATSAVADAGSAASSAVSSAASEATSAATQAASSAEGAESAGEDGAGDPAAGKSVFSSNCSACHTLKDAGASGSVGPNLDDLKPDAATVQGKVENGGGGMPPFKGTLSDTDIANVAAYVSSVAGK